MHLIQELGEGYFRERFAGCMFLNEEGDPAFIENLKSWDAGHVACAIVKGPSSKPTIDEVQIPYTFFKDLSVFAVPPLGWRASSQGRYLAHFSRDNRSYQRAISTSILRRVVSPASQYLLDTNSLSADYYERPSTTVSMIMKPEYHSMQKGIAMMREGKLFSFCTSANISVMPDTLGRQSIFFNTQRVGTVESDGSIRCVVPIIQSLIEAQL